MILSGFVAIEAVVELRGCGVLFSQMTAASFAIFIPALIGPPARAACCRCREWPVDERGVGVPPQAGSRAACCCSSRRQAVARRGVPRLSHPTR